jgi:hypothetical protein
MLYSIDLSRCWRMHISSLIVYCRETVFLLRHIRTSDRKSLSVPPIYLDYNATTLLIRSGQAIYPTSTNTLAIL